eukprot:TRINITY_DN60981_c0_g1_i1.p1 TRINITY_DN60981_c0_g1~~TRINITY_DN60981_c0_g1_i1.p1  ORF type:complete len:304 (+),score=77.30 TRINITY_DN60981_c0_g1_i1:66-977(+)
MAAGGARRSRPGEEDVSRVTLPGDVLRCVLQLSGRHALRKFVACSRGAMDFVMSDSALQRRCFLDFRPLLIREAEAWAQNFRQGTAWSGAYAHAARRLRERKEPITREEDLGGLELVPPQSPVSALAGFSTAPAARLFLEAVIEREEGYLAAHRLGVHPEGMRLRCSSLGMHWALQQLEPRYLPQGRACLEEGRVQDVRRSESGAEYLGQVRGSDATGMPTLHVVYFHTVPAVRGPSAAVGGGATFLRCTCPLHNKHHVACKHIIAVLLHAAARPPHQGWRSPHDELRGTAAVLPLDLAVPAP